MTASNAIEHGRARAFFEILSCDIIKALAALRQHSGNGEGARGAIGFGRGSMRLVEIVEREAGGKAVRVTPVGWKTLRRRMPHVIEELPASDRRRRAADYVADAIERIDSVKAANLEGSISVSMMPSDGGVTSRIRLAETLTNVRGAVNGWPFRRDINGHVPGPLILALARRSELRGGNDIRLEDALFATCVNGAPLRDILTGNGWADHPRNRKALREAVLEGLDRVAQSFGL